mgnify:CR=1 FL=1
MRSTHWSSAGVQLMGRRRASTAAHTGPGHTICFATGRRDIDMYPFWGESTYADYLLLNNGGKLLRAADRGSPRALLQQKFLHNFNHRVVVIVPLGHIVSGGFHLRQGGRQPLE